jgi:hypothetical protein
LANGKDAPHVPISNVIDLLFLDGGEFTTYYDYRALKDQSNVIVLDDADSIFNDEDALNILKAFCDTSSTRRVSWLKESNALTEDDVPKQYDFQGIETNFLSSFPVKEGRESLLGAKQVLKREKH